MSKKQSWTQLEQKEFNLVKDLQGAGLSISKAALVTKRSWGTIQMIYRNDTLDGYKQDVREQRYKYRADGAPVSRTSTPAAEEEVLAEEAPQTEVTKSLNETNLDRIATALERLADAWERQPERKGGLFK